MLDVLGITDDNARRQGGHGYLEGVEAGLPFALGEPVEELVPRLQEPDAVASKRQGPRRPSIDAVRPIPIPGEAREVLTGASLHDV